MRYVFPSLFLLLCSCNSNNQQSESIQDSVIAEFDSIDTVSQNMSGPGEPAPYFIDDKVKQMTFTVGGRSYNAQELLAVAFAPDFFDDSGVDGEEAGLRYTINDAVSISGNFFADAKTCEPSDLLLTKRMEVDAEYYDLFLLAQDKDGVLHISDKLSFEGSQGQSETNVEVVTEGIASNRSCYVLRVSSSTEGGDINLHRDSWVEYYISDSKGFHPVIRIVLEETDVQDYEAGQNENKDSSSEISSYNILASTSNGLFDLSVHTMLKQNGVITSESERTFRFNGHHYE